MLLDRLNKYDIILASASPRRKQLLEEMGIVFRLVPKSVEEVFPDNLEPDKVAEYLSKIKADAFDLNELESNALVITADTVVTINGEILGKPAHKTEAIEILQKLAGNTHQVITGVTLKCIDKQHTFSVSTNVTFSNISAIEIQYYIDTYKPFDKAGAYGIQEWIGHVAIERIEGSYFNVMGLPTHRLYQELLLFV